MHHTKIAQEIYKHFLSLRSEGKISVNLKPSSIVGTVQDDPFDFWVGEILKDALPEHEVFHSGKLTTPDIIIRDRKSGSILGLEVKKLIQQKNGSDPRGLTMDFNSCIPCGKAMIKIGEDLSEIPCFYLFALLDNSSSTIVTFILMDGDFLNYDFDSHKEAKTSNTSHYGHGPYGEGSVRQRAMYNYPNLLNSKLTPFFLKHSLIAKKVEIEALGLASSCAAVIERKDIYGNTFKYSLLDGSPSNGTIPPAIITGIFDECKNRKGKPRVASTPKITPFHTKKSE